MIFLQRKKQECKKYHPLSSMLETDRQDIVRSPKRKGKHALNAPKMPQLPHRPPPQLWSLLHDHTLLLWNILFSPVSPVSITIYFNKLDH